MALDKTELRALYEALIEWLGIENADTVMDCLMVPRDWRQWIPWHSGIRPGLPPEVRLRALYIALVERMGGELADVMMECLGAQGEWRLDVCPTRLLSAAS